MDGFPYIFNVVNSAWANENDEYNRDIPIFFERVKFWNSHVFGNVFYRKKRVLARLEGAQKAISIHPNNFLLNVDKNLMEEIYFNPRPRAAIEGFEVKSPFPSG